MVLLHPCNGVGPHSHTWARRLARWGYVTPLVDSFPQCGVQNVCNQRHGVSARGADCLCLCGDRISAIDPIRRAHRISVISF